MPERPLAILVNGVAARAGGSLTFLTEQVTALDSLGRFRLTVLASPEAAARLRGLAPSTHVVSTPMRPLAMRLIWEQTALAWRARKFDAVYMPTNFALFACPRPQLVALQNALHFGAAARQVRRALYSRPAQARLWIEALIARGSVRRADRIVTLSQSLADAVTADIGPAVSVAVVPSAVPSLPPASRTRPIAHPYVLAVANDSPNKDWDGLIDAFVANRDLPALVLVGAAREKRLADLRSRVACGRDHDRVRLLGQVTDRQVIADLYTHAECYVAHSFLESFGLTPHEALTQNVAVVASSIEAHLEICGDRATYYDPWDAAALAPAIRRTLRDGAPTSPVPSPTRDWRENASGVAALLSALARKSERRVVRQS